ncbi:hypothetical protein J2T17_007660 [Paenibacillus mucilaginosus]|uniref:hypothetical protein n=1 Tax=Paenibacillus mucilaginosus TaxID=61624 RepID=UPI003D20AA45
MKGQKGDRDAIIHHNKMDIVQRLLAENMRGQMPLKAFGIETAKVREVLSAKLPDVETKDDDADMFYILEDETLLHVEFQTTSNKDDVFRFAQYVLKLYNKYKEETDSESIKIQSFVLYAPHIRRPVRNKLDVGVLCYEFTPIFLNEINADAEYSKIADKIKQDPHLELSEEEKMLMIYKPLFSSSFRDIEREAILVVRDLKELADSAIKSRMISTVFVLTMKYLSENGQTKIWEVLKEMNIVRDEMEKWLSTGRSLGRTEALAESIRKRLNKGRSIDEIAEEEDLSVEEVNKILRVNQ